MSLFNRSCRQPDSDSNYRRTRSALENRVLVPVIYASTNLAEYRRRCRLTIRLDNTHSAISVIPSRTMAVLTQHLGRTASPEPVFPFLVCCKRLCASPPSSLAWLSLAPSGTKPIIRLDSYLVAINFRLTFLRLI